MLLGAVPLIPFLGFLTLLFFGTELPRRIVSLIGVGGIGLSFIFAALSGLQYDELTGVSQIFWPWIPASSGFATIQFGFYLDPLSLLMICMVTFVATWIALFSVKFMEDETDLARFFGSMNLFVASMLVLVLADNLLLLLLGWEGVGLCSYLLIGFWYQNQKNGRAAIKAFVTTRIGDVGLLIAILLIAVIFRTLDIQEIKELIKSSPSILPIDSTMATIVALCLLFAATGKSAQLPLQTWLPDAMLGPTPVSALIHAATMVTAGVYLIARLSALFALSGVAQTCVLAVGALTLLIAGFSALVQSDLKRVLAYSTMSQIGYMFLALGAGAYSAAIFHLLTHAFFKALLFLSAGVIGYSAHHEYNMFKLGGLRKTLPLAYYSFLVGALCLCALPLVTSGFYSKEFILSRVLFSVEGGVFAWSCGIFGAFVTGLYTFRAIRLTFFGVAKTSIEHHPGYLMTVPLLILGVLSVTIGWNLQNPEVFPEAFARFHLLSDWFVGIFPEFISHENVGISELAALLIASTISIIGMLAGFYGFKQSKASDNFMTSGFGFDTLYKYLFVYPFSFLSHFLRRDIFGQMAQGLAHFMLSLSNYLGRGQSGRISDYAGFIAFSVCAVLIVGFVVFR